MEIIDIIILLVAVVFLILGLWKGFVISLASLVALVLGIFFAVYFSDVASALISRYTEVSGYWLPVISFIITFTVVLIAIVLLGRLLDKLVSSAGIGVLNHLAGGVFGLAKGVLLLSILFFILSYTDPHEKIITPRAKQASILYTHVASVFPQLLKWTGAAEFIDKKVIREGD